jgi:hypothetical protein
LLSDALDRVIWHLSPSGLYSVQSMYYKLSQGASVAFHNDVWEARVPLKIKIFAWLLILDRLPSSLLVAGRNGPASGACALCGAPEDSSHILFSCSMARFAWSALRSILGCNWCPANFSQFHAILAGFSGRARRLLWTLFLAQSWALWTVRNKLTMEKKILNDPANLIFKMCIFLQLWSVKAKPGDREDLRRLTSELRELYASVRTRSQS